MLYQSQKVAKLARIGTAQPLKNNHFACNNLDTVLTNPLEGRDVILGSPRCHGIRGNQGIVPIFLQAERCLKDTDMGFHPANNRFSTVQSTNSRSKTRFRLGAEMHFVHDLCVAGGMENIGKGMADPVRAMLRYQDRNAQARRGLGQKHYVGNDPVGAIDRRRELFLHINNQQKTFVPLYKHIDDVIGKTVPRTKPEWGHMFGPRLHLRSLGCDDKGSRLNRELLPQDQTPPYYFKLLVADIHEILAGCIV